MRRRDEGPRYEGVRRSARSGNRAMSPTRVLVIEDDAIIGMFLSEMLIDLGYEVCAIEATEAEAVAAADRCRPGLMIVDALLGNGSGISAVATILRTGPVPHLFVTGDRA